MCKLNKVAPFENRYLDILKGSVLFVVKISVKNEKKLVVSKTLVRFWNFFQFIVVAGELYYNDKLWGIKIEFFEDSL